MKSEMVRMNRIFKKQLKEKKKERKEIEGQKEEDLREHHVVGKEIIKECGDAKMTKVSGYILNIGVMLRPMYTNIRVSVNHLTIFEYHSTTINWPSLQEITC